MNQYPVSPQTPAQRLTEKAFNSIEAFLHIEAASGVILLIATAIALVWANSPAASSYEHVWHMPITIGVGEWVFEHSLHFWINEVLMTIFFLVVGMEIRREIHDGALQNLRLAALPVPFRQRR
jgi:NhaA family Na+:H+ antiporter